MIASCWKNYCSLSHEVSVSHLAAKAETDSRGKASAQSKPGMIYSSATLWGRAPQWAAPLLWEFQYPQKNMEWWYPHSSWLWGLSKIKMVLDVSLYGALPSIKRAKVVMVHHSDGLTKTEKTKFWGVWWLPPRYIAIKWCTGDPYLGLLTLTIIGFLIAGWRGGQGLGRNN